MASDAQPTYTNRLAGETSPYLLQHAHNPVAWYPWGPEALERARREDRPILLSVGYSACHWCHVMAHESFEDPATADLMNELFVNIKVDREERPDIDAIYMDAVQAMTGQGGWPMTVFLTPTGEPFYGGTYYPPEPRYGMPSIRQVLLAVAEAWRDRRADVLQAGQRLREALNRSRRLSGGDSALEPAVPGRAASNLLNDVDRSEGGFGGAPKFPQPMALDFLLQSHVKAPSPEVLAAINLSLTKMARGGIYDHLGGGFHRYSVDAHWLVPHFEKMLYDNAQLARTYLHAWQVTGDPSYGEVVEGTLDFVLREMTSPEGGFYSTQDADSEGEEGKFYLWTPDEVTDLLGAEDAHLFCAYYGISETGNFREGGRGQNILSVQGSLPDIARRLGVPESHLAEVLTRGRQRLLAAREQRVHPGQDQKILAEWNGLTLHALAEAGAALGREDYLAAARRSGQMLLEPMSYEKDGGLRFFRSYRDGQAKLAGYLEDYASVGMGLLGLYEATLELRWLKAAIEVAEVIPALFGDEAGGGFFQTSREHEELVARRKDMIDNATPSGNSLAAELYLRLGRLTENDRYTGHAVSILGSVATAMGEQPLAFGRLLGALHFHLNPGHEVAVVGDPASPDTQALLSELWRPYLPGSVWALRAPADAEVAALMPFLAERGLVGSRPAAYVCRQYVCQLPVTEPGRLAEQLRG